MWIIAGLGNPGTKYQATRHNAGFLAVDQAANRWGPVASQEKFRSFAGTTEVFGERVLLLKPQTFMNRSGAAVAPAIRFHKLDVGRVVVLHDEIDLDFGVVRLKTGGGLAGHNGLRSIVQELGDEKFHRLRIGVGRPHKGSGASHVLGRFSPEEIDALPAILEHAVDGLELLLREGPARAMNEINRKSDGTGRLG